MYAYSRVLEELIEPRLRARPLFYLGVFSEWSFLCTFAA